MPVIIIISILSILIPSGLVRPQSDLEVANAASLKVNFRLNHEVLRQGQKGIDCSKVSFIDIRFDTGYQVAAETDLAKIEVLVNGSKNVTTKFTIDSDPGIIRLTPVPGETLEKHVLYSVHVPQGILINNSKCNEPINLYFTTKADEGDYCQDILQAVSPAQDAVQVDNTGGKIEFTFIDDISIAPSVLQNIASYIQISSQKMYSQLPGYNIPPSYQQDDSINNYNVQVQGNKLIIQAKYGYFKDFANYTVKLKNNTVFLKRPYEETKNSLLAEDSAAVHIYNQDENNEEYQVLKFSTGNMLSTTSPLNNATGVSVEPAIKFQFKYPVEFNEDVDESDISSYISISSDEEEVYLDNPGDVTISRDGKTLQIYINDETDSQAQPLNRNSLYQVIINPGLLRFVNYPIYNDEISLQFTTRGEGESPAPVGYYSDSSGSDDIRYLDHRSEGDYPSSEKLSNLDSSGAIYIKFDRPIQADPQNDINYLPLLQATHLYKMPALETAADSASGAATNGEIAYNLYKAADNGYATLDNRIIPAAIPVTDVAGNYDILEDEYYMEEIPLAKVEIVSPDLLKITPQKSLLNLNKYKLLVDKSVIEDYNGYNLEKDIEFSFWVKGDSNNTQPNWLTPGNESTKQAQEVTGTTNKTYKIYGAPLYGPDQPLVLNIDCEVIPRAKDELLTAVSGEDLRRIQYDQLMNIKLADTYNTDSTKKNVEIDRYVMEYYTETENGVKKTKTRFLLYPAQLLDNGKQYRLSIPQGTLESRSRIKMAALDIDIITGGDSNLDSEVFQLEDNAAKVTDVWKKGEWAFKIRGNNFNDQIEEIKLTPVTGRVLGPPSMDPVIITQDDIEFRSVTELLVKIRGENAKKFSQEEYTGQYKITVTFAGGSSQELGVGTITEMNLVLQGNNLRSDVKKVTLQQVGGSTNITLENTTDKQEIEFINNQQMVLKITGDNARTMAGTSSSGEYQATIYYESLTPWTQSLTQWNLDIYGKDFADTIKDVILRPLSGNAASLAASEQEIVIQSTDIQRVSDSKLIARISGDTLNKLKEAAHSGDYQLLVQSNGKADYISDMKIFISSSYGLQVTQTVQADLTDTLTIDNQVYIPGKFYFTLLSKGKPQAVDFYPRSTGKYDQNTLPHDIQDAVTSNHQFLKVSFEDIDGKLTFNSMSSMRNISVAVQGSSSSVLNGDFLTLIQDKGTEYINKYLFKNDRSKGLAYLYIPVLNMQSQMSYVVTIPAEVVKNDSSDKYNASISWTFATMSIPSVKEKNVLQTVVEDYDLNVPIIITGDQFYESVAVYFNNTKASKIDPPKDNGQGQQYIAVYLPDPRLEPGLYNITIANDQYHKQILYGTLSVVASGKYAPEEGRRVISDEHEGQVVESVMQSEDTLLLKKAYTDRKKLKLDLDEIMGEDVLTRKIKWEGKKSDSIDELITLSRWVDITLYGVSIDSTKNKDEAEIRLGRTTAVLTRSLTNKLRGQAICSDFIEVGGDNLRLKKVDLNIPFQASDVENLKALRYDEKLRKWFEVTFEVNWVDQEVAIADSQAGVFVVVEQGGR